MTKVSTFLHRLTFFNAFDGVELWLMFRQHYVNIASQQVLVRKLQLYYFFFRQTCQT